MDFLATSALCFLILLLFIWWTKSRRDRKWPPGPKIIPFLGNLNINHSDILGEFCRFRRQYGDVFSLILGSQTLIVINGLETLKEFFIKHGEFVSGRPNSILFQDICEFQGIIGSSGELWKEHRTFAIATLRSFGFGKKSFDGKIREEVEVFLKIVGEYEGKAFDLTELVHISTSNVVCSVILGLRYDHNNRNFQGLCSLISDQMKNANIAGIITFLPFLKYIPFDPFKFSKLLDNKEKILDQLRCVTEERRDHFDQNITNNYVDAYLKRQNEDLKSGKMSTFTDEQMLISVNDLFAAGTETTATAIKWFVVFILNNPDIQRRMREEIYEIIGHSRLPSISDKDRMTYCDAVMHETLRLGNIVPLSIPHGAIEEFCFRDYIIPKGATLIPNLDSVAYDHELFEDPFDFKPSRFLDEKGNLVGTEKVMAFGIGRRVCLGEALARMELFLFATALVQRFELHPENDGVIPPLLDGVLGVTRSPLPFKIRAIEA